MFERFTREARRVVTQAVEEAHHRSDARVGTDHLLIGAVDTGAGRQTGLSPAAVRGELERIDQEALAAVGVDPRLIATTPGAHPRAHRHLPFTGASKDILKQSLREAIAMNHRHIGAEHILLALTTLPEPDRATQALRGLGIDPAALRQSLLETLHRAS
ncbi:MAG TPA: Clp protease N-terminal domain-containing protein [Acidimicrobiia bacterium]|nr:Clp protease N-terminal domain-containing protein [Acidimicrobiia bacterium]